MFKKMYVAAIKLYKKEERTNQIRYFSPLKVWTDSLCNFPKHKLLAPTNENALCGAPPTSAPPPAPHASCSGPTSVCTHARACTRACSLVLHSQSPEPVRQRLLAHRSRGPFSRSSRDASSFPSLEFPSDVTSSERLPQQDPLKHLSPAP